MKILILGGTVFLGRHLVSAAKNAGHELTLFNRGNHPQTDETIEQIRGDRNADLDILLDRKWDAVIDTCGMKPDEVVLSAAKMSNCCQTYVYISSISAYENFRKEGTTEHDATKLTPRDKEQDYGSDKAWCEKAVLEHVPETRALIIRPGLLVGRYDPTDRFTYWVRRIAQGGQVLAPGRPEREIQFIDIRDCAEWIIRLLEAKIHGTFNLTGPFYPYTMGEFLRACVAESGSNAELVWASDQELAETKVTPWTELPFWLPETDIDHRGLMKVDSLKAQNTGLSYRAVHETIGDTLDWDKSRDQKIPLEAGLSHEKERDLLSTLRK